VTAVVDGAATTAGLVLSAYATADSVITPAKTKLAPALYTFCILIIPLKNTLLLLIYIHIQAVIASVAKAIYCATGSS
jgi:hypothetical protein